MADDIRYTLQGNSMQYLEIALEEDQTVIAEAGHLLYMEEGIRFETRMGDGAGSAFGALFGAAKRMITGESLFMTHFTNRRDDPKKVAFAAPYPGQIVPVQLSEHDGEIICQKDAFLAAARGTEVDVVFNRRLGVGFFGGEGFVLQRLRGEGLAFLHAGGSIVEKTLHGETLRVDTGCVVGFEEDIDYDVELAGGLRSMLFGGEGMFLATLEGHGKVWLQSLPFARLADRVLENAVHEERQDEDT